MQIQKILKLIPSSVNKLHWIFKIWLGHCPHLVVRRSTLASLFLLYYSIKPDNRIYRSIWSHRPSNICRTYNFDDGGGHDRGRVPSPHTDAPPSNRRPHQAVHKTVHRLSERGVYLQKSMPSSSTDPSSGQDQHTDLVRPVVEAARQIHRPISVHYHASAAGPHCTTP